VKRCTGRYRPRRAQPAAVFQRVPEGKAAKNCVHLDVNVGRDAIEAMLQ
jgi:hypothetical protein